MIWKNKLWNNIFPKADKYYRKSRGFKISIKLPRKEKCAGKANWILCDYAIDFRMYAFDHGLTNDYALSAGIEVSEFHSYFLRIYLNLIFLHFQISII